MGELRLRKKPAERFLFWALDILKADEDRNGECEWASFSNFLTTWERN
jgi:hypothetical protein